MIPRFAVLIVLLLAPSVGRACQIPVFRYALERWPSDYYALAVFTKGDLTEEQEKLLDEIDSGIANVETVRIDLDKQISEQLKPFGIAEPKEGELAARLFFPFIAGIEKPVWEGSLTRETYERLVDSPMRREVIKKILAGQSAVWVILESGDAEKDAKMEKELKEHLEGAKEWLQIPEGVVEAEDYERVERGEGSMKDMLRSEIPMQIAFDVVRMKRGDPEEEIFEKILLAVSSAPEEKLAGEPVAFPIFGRGRTVDGIPGKEMTEELMGYACSYICGACSCEVKRDNPGADILMTADWDEALEGNWVVVDKELPPLAGVGDLIEAKTAPPETPSADTPQPANPQATGAAKSTLPKNLIWLGCGLLAVLVIATILVKRGTRR